MRVLGIDPGTISMGYGLIEADGDAISLVDCGALKAVARAPVAERLWDLYQKLEEVMDRHQPHEVAIEEPFVAKNPRSALAIGQAQTVAILAASGRGIPIFHYPPARVKQVVTSFGGSDKGQVQEMVRIYLGLVDLPRPADAADALAVAICHLRERQLSRLLERG